MKEFRITPQNSYTGQVAVLEYDGGVFARVHYAGDNYNVAKRAWDQLIADQAAGEAARLERLDADRARRRLAESRGMAEWIEWGMEQLKGLRPNAMIRMTAVDYDAFVKHLEDQHDEIAANFFRPLPSKDTFPMLLGHQVWREVTT